MQLFRDTVEFVLNESLVTVAEVSPNDMLLDHLRLERRLTGTKEGCAEGDCGACTVLVGKLDESDNVVYEPINSCIRFLASVDGCHVVTVEYLSRGGNLHPVQDAMVREHGAQCGFCTPGIVMSLYALWMSDAKPSRGQIEEALQGNLCRCTGYAPILRAATRIDGDPKKDKLTSSHREITESLKGIRERKSLSVRSEEGVVYRPKDADALAGFLVDNPEATVVAGGTDVGLWVTKLMRSVSPVVHISQIKELHRIGFEDGRLIFGSCVSYTDFTAALQKYLPTMMPFWLRIGGWQVRNMGTIGGNIANGSPIGDTPPMLMCLDARLLLRHGKDRRTLPLEKFFIEYGKQDLRPGEFIEEISLLPPRSDEIFECHKITKRRDEDISSLCGAFLLNVEDGRVSRARIAFGGMAGIPQRAINVENALIGATWTEETLAKAQAEFENDYRPISDQRASAEYRLKTAQNLLRRVFLNNSSEEKLYS